MDFKYDKKVWFEKLILMFQKKKLRIELLVVSIPQLMEDFQ